MLKEMLTIISILFILCKDTRIIFCVGNDAFIASGLPPLADRVVTIWIQKEEASRRTDQPRCQIVMENRIKYSHAVKKFTSGHFPPFYF